MGDMEKIRIILGNNMKLLRRSLRMNQEELAEKAGLSIGFIKDIERGVKWASPSTLQNIAVALNSELENLFIPPEEKISKNREYGSIKGETSEIVHEALFRVNRIPESIFQLAMNFESDNEVWDMVESILKAKLEANRRKRDQSKKA